MALYGGGCSISLTTEDYEKGLKDGREIGASEAWLLARKIAFPNMELDERVKIFGDCNVSISDVLIHFSYSDAKAKLEEYERKQKEPKVGDVYESIFNKFKAVVVDVKGTSIEIMFSHFGKINFNVQEFLTKYKPTGENIKDKLDSVVSELEV